MPEQNHDYVDFMGYNGQTDAMERICRVYLTDGKLFYEGKQAKSVERLVKTNPFLKQHHKMGGYALLAALPHVFKGSMFYATEIKEPYQEEEP